MKFKRFLALLLAVMLLVSVLPTAGAVSAREQEDEDIWAQITALEDGKLNTRARAGRGELPTTAEFARISTDVEALVRSSAGYREGSVIRHGDFFFWEDINGEVYGYSPRLRAKMREDAANASADPETLSGTETVSYATRGGNTGGVNVAVFQPYYGLDSSFKTTYSTEGTRIAQALGGTSTTYKTTAATIDQVADALENCGVVIFDSHGDTDYANGEDYTSRANTSYLCMQTNAGWTSADKQAVTGPYGTYYHCYNAGSYGSMKYYCVDGTGFANHMSGTGCNNFLWMAICLGMATDGLNKPLHEKGVEVVYGYSQSVTFDGDYTYEEYFWDHMIDGYTAGESFAYMKQQAGCDWDPGMGCSTVSQARANYAAFPILVSSEDAYPGHGNVDKVTTPTSSWTLLPTFTVNAVSNNEAWGTVSVSGTKITASPKTGYYTAGYEVTEGTAAVEQNGNEFNVTPESDCTVRIDFAAKTPATLTFVTPDGVECADLNTYVGDTVTLPKPTGTPTADAQDYRFIGWTTATVSDTEVRPAYLTAGSELKVTGNTTYYALYSYAIKEGETITGFAKVQDEPALWSGEYVLTYNGSIVLDASGEYTGAALGSKDAAKAIAVTGITADGDTLLDVDDKYVYVIETSATVGGCYTIRMKNSSDYIAFTGSTNAVTTTTSAGDASAQWELGFSDGKVSIRNHAQPTRYLQYNTTSKQFRCYLNTMKNLTLFSGTNGTAYFTTELSAACAHNFEISEQIDATCTEDGKVTYTCTLCSYSYSETLAAPGHGWSLPGYVWAEDNSTCTASRLCARCLLVEDETVQTSSAVTLAPTVEAEGELTYTAEFENEAFETQTKSVTIPKLDPTDPCADGHDWGETEYVWAEDYSSCTATRVCKNNAEHVETETAKADGVVTKPATEEEEGEIIYTAVFTNKDFGMREKAVVIPKLEPQPTTPFEDVEEGKYYTDAVAWAVEHEPQITNGVDATHFNPTGVCTRGQVVTFLWRAHGEPEPTESETPFADVEEGKFYDKAVLWAVENGITNGVDDTHFNPAGECTRAHVVTFLWRAVEGPAATVTECPFEDAVEGSFYYNAMLWAVESGVTKGVDDTHFAPGKPCTRAEVVTFLFRAEG